MKNLTIKILNISFISIILFAFIVPYPLAFATGIDIELKRSFEADTGIDWLDATQEEKESYKKIYAKKKKNEALKQLREQKQIEAYDLAKQRKKIQIEKAKKRKQAERARVAKQKKRMLELKRKGLRRDVSNMQKKMTNSHRR